MAGREPWPRTNPRRYRYARGERHPRARLSDDDVRLVRELHELGLGYHQIAQKFEVSKSSVRDICCYRTRC